MPRGQNKRKGRNTNEQIAQKLEQEGPDYPKNIAYRQAAEAVANYPNPIQSGQQARQEISGVGNQIASKIDDILANQGGNRGSGGRGGNRSRSNSKNRGGNQD